MVSTDKISGHVVMRMSRMRKEPRKDCFEIICLIAFVPHLRQIFCGTSCKSQFSIQQSWKKTCPHAASVLMLLMGVGDPVGLLPSLQACCAAGQVQTTGKDRRPFLFGSYWSAFLSLRADTMFPLDYCLKPSLSLDSFVAEYATTERVKGDVDGSSGVDTRPKHIHHLWQWYILIDSYSLADAGQIKY